jgi:hypothetical protein
MPEPELTPILERIVTSAAEQAANEIEHGPFEQKWEPRDQIVKLFTDRLDARLAEHDQ